MAFGNFGENAWTDVYSRVDAHERSFSCSQTFSAIYCGNLRPSGLTTSRVSAANAIKACDWEVFRDYLSKYGSGRLSSVNHTSKKQPSE